jgi:glycosyltransferase involved in cell wall biosynthesis
MPIRNEESSIQRSLSAVLSQDYPSELMEVLVVDGRSTDNTRELVTSTARTATTDGKPEVKLLDNPGRIVPSALNTAIASARGDVIVRVDGHCEIREDYVRRCVETLRSSGADNVGGIQRARGVGVVGRAIALATMSRFGIGNARFRLPGAEGCWTDTVYLGAYRRDVFDRVGLFDEALVNNQDDEFNLRLIRAGGRIWLSPQIVVTYAVRPSLRRLGTQYFRYGLYKPRVILKHHTFSLRHLVPAVFVVALALGAGLWAVAGRPELLIAVAGSYLAFGAAASVRTAGRDVRVLLVLPVVFGTLHFAYGLGFLCGIWKAWRLRRGRTDEPRLDR